MRQPLRRLRQDRFKTNEKRTHYPDHRESAVLTLAGLTVLALALMTTPVVAGFAAFAPVSLMLVQARHG